jgi:hypothetical protein
MQYTAEGGLSFGVRGIEFVVPALDRLQNGMSMVLKSIGKGIQNIIETSRKLICLQERSREPPSGSKKWLSKNEIWFCQRLRNHFQINQIPGNRYTIIYFKHLKTPNSTSNDIFTGKNSQSKVAPSTFSPVHCAARSLLDFQTFRSPFLLQLLDSRISYQR